MVASGVVCEMLAGQTGANGPVAELSFVPIMSAHQSPASAEGAVGSGNFDGEAMGLGSTLSSGPIRSFSTHSAHQS
jgi:hypothetical protein